MDNKASEYKGPMDEDDEGGGLNVGGGRGKECNGGKMGTPVIEQ